MTYTPRELIAHFRHLSPNHGRGKAVDTKLQVMENTAFLAGLFSAHYLPDFRH
jgi:hypothetical protein